MRHLEIRHIAAAGALALIASAPLAACATPSAAPRSVQAADEQPATAGVPSAPGTSADSRAGATAPGTTPPGIAGPAGIAVPPGIASPPGIAGPPHRARPAKTTGKPAPTSTKHTGTCYGAVRHDLDLHNNVLDLITTMCFHTGGVLRLQGIGPGLVTAVPASVASTSYEAGVVDVHFVRPGTATVTIPQDGRDYTITVVVRS
jgi:hypothetical protein